MCGHLWQVVGGGGAGGISVRTAPALSSPPKGGRLATGALVQGLTLLGDRLRFRKLAGAGPKVGWVSLQLKGRALLIRVRAAYSDADPATHPEPVQLTETIYPDTVFALLRIPGGPLIATREREEDGRTLLHVAACVLPGDDAVISICTLLSARAEVNSRTSLGETPLTLAGRAAAGHSASGAGPTRGEGTQDNDAQHDDGRRGDEQGPERLMLVRLLLERRADANAAETLLGETPLMEAASDGQSEACKLLLEFRADAALQNYAGQNAWCLARSGGHAPLAEVFAAASERPAPLVGVWVMVPDLGVSVLVDVPAVAATVGEVRLETQRRLGLAARFVLKMTYGECTAELADARRLGVCRELSASVIAGPGATGDITDAESWDETEVLSATDDSAGSVSEVVKRLRAECIEAGFSVLWCLEEEQLRSMLRHAKRWAQASYSALVRECEDKGIPHEGVTGLGELAFRLRQTMVWEIMDHERLERACRECGAPLAQPVFLNTRGAGGATAARKAEAVAKLVRSTFHSSGLEGTGCRGEVAPPGSLGQRAGPGSIPPPPWASSSPSSAVHGGRGEAPGESVIGHGRRGEVDGVDDRRHARERRQPLRPESDSCTDEKPADSARFTGRPGTPRLGPQARPQARPPPGAPLGFRELAGHFRALGLAPGSPAEDVRRSFRKLALQLHPDKNLARESATEEFRQLAYSYEAIVSARAGR